MRKTIRKLHFLLAAISGLFVVTSGLTGSALVIGDWLDQRLEPQLRLHDSPPKDATLALQQGYDRVRERDAAAVVQMIRLPRDANQTLEFHVTAGDETRRIYTDPATGRVLGERGEHEGLIGTLHDLHVHLFAGETGHTFVGIFGLSLLGMIITGLYLWWPGVRNLGGALRVQWRTPWKRGVYDLHRVIGFFGSVLLLVSCLTGLALVFFNVAMGGLTMLLGGSGFPRRVALTEPAGDWMSLDDLLARAEAALPGAESTYIFPPTLAEPGAGAMIVRMRFAENPHPNGNSFVSLHPTTGEVVAVHDHRRSETSLRVFNLAYPIHIGHIGGIIGQTLTMITGLLPLLLLITGTLMWWNRHRGRRRMKAAPRSAGPFPEAIDHHLQPS